MLEVERDWPVTFFSTPREQGPDEEVHVLQGNQVARASGSSMASEKMTTLRSIKEELKD